MYGLKQGHGLLRGGECGKPVGDDEQHVVIVRRVVERGAACIGKTAAQVRAAQILCAIDGGAMNIDDVREARLRELRAQGIGIERLMHGVARLRMRQIEREQGRGRHAAARAAESNTRIREVPQRLQRIPNNIVTHARSAHSSKRACDDVPSSAPRASVMLIDSSQLSNSGARRRPSTSRA